MITRIAFRNLFRNFRRTAVTAVTVATGVGGLFAFQGFNSGLMNQYRENAIHILYGYGQVNTAGYRDQVFEKPHAHWIENSAEVMAGIKEIPGVTHVLPRIEFFGLLTNGQISLSGKGIGIDGPMEKEFFNRLRVTHGEPLGSHHDGLVIGSGLARSLNVKVGDTVTVLTNTIYGSINGADLTVIGIFHSGGPAFDDHIFQIQLPQAQELLDTQSVEKVTLGLEGLSSWDSVSTAIANRYPDLETTPFNVLDKVIYQNGVDFLDRQFEVIRMIILLIIVLGIFNTASSAIMERVTEFGNLRANGDSFADVLRLVGVEALFLALLGSGLGLGLVVLAHYTILAQGIWMPPGPGITEGIFVFLELQPLHAIEAVVLGLVISIGATLLAGMRAASIPIAQALRSPS
jgi:putative ABC transport system permease protein